MPQVARVPGVADPWLRVCVGGRIGVMVGIGVRVRNRNTVRLRIRVRVRIDLLCLAIWLSVRDIQLQCNIYDKIHISEVIHSFL